MPDPYKDKWHLAIIFIKCEELVSKPSLDICQDKFAQDIFYKMVYKTSFMCQLHCFDALGHVTLIRNRSCPQEAHSLVER